MPPGRVGAAVDLPHHPTGEGQHGDAGRVWAYGTQNDREPMAGPLSYSCTTMRAMASRKKRSISMPPDLDAQIQEAAKAGGVTYSAWLAAAARKEFLLQDGVDDVAEFERTNGAFTDAEMADAEAWAADAVNRSRRTGAASRRSA